VISPVGAIASSTWRLGPICKQQAIREDSSPPKSTHVSSVLRPTPTRTMVHHCTFRCATRRCARFPPRWLTRRPPGRVLTKLSHRWSYPPTASDTASPDCPGSVPNTSGSHQRYVVMCPAHDRLPLIVRRMAPLTSLTSAPLATDCSPCIEQVV
jgi:hypothetical protein